MTQKLKVSFSPERGVERVTAAWRREEDSYKDQDSPEEKEQGPSQDEEAGVWGGRGRD